MQSPFVLQLWISMPASTDKETIEKLCSMDGFNRVRYLNTFKNNGKTFEDAVAKEINEVSNRKLDCVILEVMLIDADEINKKECTLVLNFYANVEYHFDESESIDPNQAQANLENVLRTGCPSGWIIN